MTKDLPAFSCDDRDPSLRSGRDVGTKGLWYMALASVLFSLMGTCIFWAGTLEPGISILGLSFVRLFVNLVLVFSFAVVTRSLIEFTHYTNWSLWLRGFFGSLSLMMSFSSIIMIGIGESSFLLTANAVFVALLAPFFLKQKSSWLTWVAVIGSFIGLYFMFEPRLTDAHPGGRALALGAGFFASLAFLSMARAGQKNSPHAVVFYFCVIGTVMHLLLMPFFDVTWPQDMKTWAVVLAAGVFATFAQYFMTQAYQMTPAALNAVVGYLTPVMNLALGVVFFATVPDARSLLGAVIVLTFGIILPFAHVRRHRC